MFIRGSEKKERRGKRKERIYKQNGGKKMNELLNRKKKNKCTNNMEGEK